MFNLLIANISILLLLSFSQVQFVQFVRFVPKTGSIMCW